MYGLHVPNRPPRNELTPREREVLDFVLAGKPNKLTAWSLGISQRTVEVHRSRIFQKMGVRNAIELVAAVYARGGTPMHALAEPQAAAIAPAHAADAPERSQASCWCRT